MGTIVTIILIGLIIIAVIAVMGMIKVSSEYDKASEALYKNQIQYMENMEKVKRHKKMLDEANQNPEYIEKSDS